MADLTVSNLENGDGSNVFSPVTDGESSNLFFFYIILLLFIITIIITYYLHYYSLTFYTFVTLLCGVLVKILPPD